MRNDETVKNNASVTFTNNVADIKPWTEYQHWPSDHRQPDTITIKHTANVICKYIQTNKQTNTKPLQYFKMCMLNYVLLLNYYHDLRLYLLYHTSHFCLCDSMTHFRRLLVMSVEPWCADSNVNITRAKSIYLFYFILDELIMCL